MEFHEECELIERTRAQTERWADVDLARMSAMERTTYEQGIAEMRLTAQQARDAFAALTASECRERDHEADDAIARAERMESYL